MGDADIVQEGLPIGQIVGGYLIKSAIQKGGMGELFLAERVYANNQKVVLKRLLADYLSDERYVRMFRSEAKVMSSLDHPNIVKVVDVPVVDGKQCLALEYVQGRNLAQILKRCAELGTAIPAPAALFIMTEVLRGLHYAHEFVLSDGRPLGLVHRDVTPGNILVSYDGEVKITDFGISKSEMSQVSTTVGVVKGTTRYLSPEQIRGQPATPRSDLFSAAVVAVEALTGRALFDHGTVPPTLYAIVTGERPSIAQLLPFTAVKLEATLERALDLNPEARFSTAGAFLEALMEAAAGVGQPMDAPGLGTFLKELFRGTGHVPELLTSDDGNPFSLDAMDLTYLFEVQQQDVDAFKSDSPAGRDPRSNELNRVRALLKQAVPGAQPLNAGEFEEESSHPNLTDDLIVSDGTQPVRPDMVESSRNVSADLEPLPEGRSDDINLDETPIGVFEEELDSPVLERLSGISEPMAQEALAPPVLEKPRRWPVPLAFVLGVAAGVAGLFFGRPYAEPYVQAYLPHLIPPAQSVEEKPTRIQRLADPVTVFAPITQTKAVEHEGGRRGRAPELVLPAKVDIIWPRGARVRIDGEWRQRRVPLRGLLLPPGPHVIDVVKRRYKRSLQVDLKPNETLVISRR